ncbi:hypothetical protein [Stutzerimonas kunmingensis]|uniref:hypothetical protein n=1 Tax=Stutzerimonas kunmingensis TaxID=1211807 RepID=UPI00241DF475|nr:hypothetical protein [Stutzerimonas kunmingensis]
MKALMIGVGVYLLGGLVFIAVAEVKSRLQCKDEVSLDDEDSYLVWLVLLVLWLPVIAYALCESWLHKPRVSPVYREFLATPESLAQRYSKEEVAQMEIYHDPFGAVPPVPFGHLHEAWLRFREHVGSEDELWSFTIDTRNDPGIEAMSKYGTVHGYALVRNSTVVQEIYTRMG